MTSSDYKNASIHEFVNTNLETVHRIGPWSKTSTVSPILTKPNVEGHGRNILAADEALGSSSLDPEQVGRHRLDVVAVVADDPG